MKKNIKKFSEVILNFFILNFILVKININNPNDKTIKLSISEIEIKKCKNVIINEYKNKPIIPAKA
jgi:hypothetical protein